VIEKRTLAELELELPPLDTSTLIVNAHMAPYIIGQNNYQVLACP
jgi:hypothetical protein